MAIPSRQIGWSTQSNLLWQISKELDRLICVTAGGCTPTTTTTTTVITNFDVTAQWGLATPSVVDEASFRTFLESGQDGDGNTNDQTGVVITDFLLVGDRLTCNVSSTGGSNLAFSFMNITDATSFGNLQITGYLYLYSNNIPSVDNTSWPIGVNDIDLGNNSITSFDNVTWPSSLTGYLGLYSNGLTSFNPSIPLPDSINTLGLENNQMTTAGYTGSEPWANAMSVIPGRGNVYIYGNVNSASGTNLETILIAKGWSVSV